MKKVNYLWVGLGLTCLIPCFFFTLSRRQLVLFQCLYMLAVAFIAFIMHKKGWKLHWTVIFMAISMVVKIGYIFATPVWVRQHDFIDFGVGFGHGGYIEYFYYNKKLPDFDPREVWAFFQPPLHHIIAALWLGIQTSLGVAYRHAQENVQALTMFYAGGTVLLSHEIFKKMSLQGLGLFLPTLLIAFHPAIILLSGSLNNDALSLFLQVTTLYFTIVWYQKPSMGRVIGIAISIGCSMMAKVSGFLIAPAIALVFLDRWICEKECFKKYLGQFFVFGLISLPLGLWYPIRNFVKFKVPFNYTPHVGEPVGNVSWIQRIFDMRTEKVFVSLLSNQDAYDEYNIPLTLLKTAMFGETDLSIGAEYIIPFANLLFCINIVLVLLSLGAMGYYFIKKTAYIKGMLKWSFLLYYVVMMLFYFQFNFSMPYFSSQDFRYIIPTAIIGAMFLGFLLQDLEIGKEKGKNKFFLSLIRLMTGLFCFSSFAVYVLLIMNMG